MKNILLRVLFLAAISSSLFTAEYTGPVKIKFANGHIVELSQEAAERSGYLATGISFKKAQKKNLEFDFSKEKNKKSLEFAILLLQQTLTPQKLFSEQNPQEIIYIINAVIYLDSPELLNQCINELPSSFAYYDTFSWLQQHSLNINNLIDYAIKQQFNIPANNSKFATSQPLTDHTGSISSIAWSPDGTRLATGSYDKTARIWTRDEEGKWVSSSPLTDHTGSISSIAWSPDGTQLATGSEDKTARIWTRDEEGKWVSSSPLADHTQKVRSVAWSPDGTQLATGSEDNTARIWTRDENNHNQWNSSLPLNGHNDNITSLAWSPDSKQLATSSLDSTVLIWTRNENNHNQWNFSELPESHINWVKSVVWSRDNNQFATLSWDKTAHIWTHNTHRDSGSLLNLLKGITKQSFY